MIHKKSTTITKESINECGSTKTIDYVYRDMCHQMIDRMDRAELDKIFKLKHTDPSSKQSRGILIGHPRISKEDLNDLKKLRDTESEKLEVTVTLY